MDREGLGMEGSKTDSIAFRHNLDGHLIIPPVPEKGNWNPGQRNPAFGAQ